MSERYVDPALNMPRVAPPDAPRDEPRAANTAHAEEDTDFELWLIYNDSPRMSHTTKKSR